MPATSMLGFTHYSFTHYSFTNYSFTHYSFTHYSVPSARCNSRPASIRS